jgi:hypothetical protein
MWFHNRVKKVPIFLSSTRKIPKSLHSGKKHPKLPNNVYIQFQNQAIKYTYSTARKFLNGRATESVFYRRPFQHIPISADIYCKLLGAARYHQSNIFVMEVVLMMRATGLDPRPFQSNSHFYNPLLCDVFNITLLGPPKAAIWFVTPLVG